LHARYAPRVLRVKGINNETLVLDGEWLEKLRGNEPRAKLPASSFRSAELKEFDRRKKLFGGEREQLIQAVLTFAEPPFLGITIPAENRGELDELIAKLESQRAG
jgi:hypothetical protein